ncbi:hypothetical protein CI1B_28930 [Bradyrhizobium ivorense]|uniref:Uncharacterized protein n=1 Tax=Bradyrhizobium ivorense TaxID=2511166 RepID=A0A508T316_9BRAD|nr:MULTISPECIES: hypothetical protein [Bradyrhizobium]QOZ27001.1 hypothetical protein XH93_27855 [Bradyrhizobium sp. CCBAU 51753]VIO69685.1 hypothetical protein CI1B_28930 [Bradyrhizobium ivorense]VIO76576.1 hypothetical protein CI41S_52780 [Bradyrhizobium ivorense]
MDARLISTLGALGLAGGYVVYDTSNSDPTVYPYSRQQAQTMLVAAKTTLPRRDKSGQIEIWSTGRSSKGVMLNMKYASKAPLITCDVAITDVGPDKVRVVPDCGADPKQESAINRTSEELRVPMFAEHVEATLNKREFSRERVSRKEVAITFKNLNEMQNEALQTYADEQRLLHDTYSTKR